MDKPKKEKKKRNLKINFDGPNLDVNIIRDEENLEIEVIKSKDSNGEVKRNLLGIVRKIIFKG